MTKTRFAPWVVLACIGTLAGCNSGEGGTVGNTELNVIVPNNGDQSPGPLPNQDPQPAFIDIQVVEYTIACNDGNTPGPFLDNAASFDDDITISGVLEVLDTAAPGVTTQDFGPDLTDVYIWQGFMDLPPTAGCTVQLRARDGDGEVICTATESFDIAADSTTKVNVLMYCGISFQAPVGMLDLDGDFSFNVANFCPDLFVLNCVSSNPQVQIPGLPPVTYCETRYRDGDSQCGDSCDPQTCVNTPEGQTCTPGPDPGVSTKVTCDQILDCEGDFIPDASCTWAGDVSGAIGAGIPVPVLQGGPGPDPGGFFTGCLVCNQAYIDATFDTDPTCNSTTGPTGNPITPGVTISCTAVTTDGDVDCDKTKIVEYVCPGSNPCTIAPFPGACDDGNDCTGNVCDPSSGSAVCSNPNSPPGTACVAAGGGLCDGSGNCIAQGCTSDAECELDGNVCTVPPAGACDTVTGQCAPEVPGNDGGTCDTGVGSGDGSCSGGVCLSNDVCTGPGDPLCDDANDCTQNVCSGVPFVCSNPNEPAGTSCDAGGGPGSGACDGAGVCAPPPVIGTCNLVSNWRALPKVCTEGVFDATAFLYTCCDGAGDPDPACTGNGNTTTDVPGGGTANAFSDPVSPYRGCEVPSSALAGQLATDTFMDLTVTSTGDGNLTTSYDVVAVNAALGIAAAIAELVDLNAFTTIKDGVPAQVTNSLNPAFYNTPVGLYVTGGNTFTLTGGVEIDVNTEQVVPTSSPNVSINFSRNFLLELFLTTALQPLNIDGASCTFDLPGPDAVCPVN